MVVAFKTPPEHVCSSLTHLVNTVDEKPYAVERCFRKETMAQVEDVSWPAARARYNPFDLLPQKWLG